MAARSFETQRASVYAPVPKTCLVTSTQCHLRCNSSTFSPSSCPKADWHPRSTRKCCVCVICLHIVCVCAGCWCCLLVVEDASRQQQLSMTLISGLHVVFRHPAVTGHSIDPRREWRLEPRGRRQAKHDQRLLML